MAPRRIAWVALAAAAGLAVLSQAGTALVVERRVRQPEAIVVLASHEFERIPAAAALARQHPSSVVLLTVPRAVSEHNCQRCPFRPEWLAQEGVTLARVRTLPQTAANTREEALAVLAYRRRHPFGRLAVVTSPYHTRRSLGTFETIFANTGVEIGVYPATAFSPAAPRRWWLGRYDRGYVMYEWAALAYYRARFGVPLRPPTRLSPPRQISVSGLAE